jgi:hypothetical protein
VFPAVIVAAALARGALAAEEEAGAAPTRVPLVWAGEPRAEVVVGAGCDGCERRAADIFVREIARRTGCTLPVVDDGPSTGCRPKVRLLIGGAARNRQVADLQRLGRLRLPDPSAPDGFSIETCHARHGRAFVVSGATGRGTLYGVGRLLHSLSFRGRTALAPSIQACDGPDHPFRALFLATHLQDVGYKDWTVEQWRAYVAELALWGADQVWYLPMQFGQMRNVFQGQGTEEQQRRWGVYQQVPGLVHELGLEVGIYLGVNDIFEDQMTPELAATYGWLGMEQNEACPSKPAAWRLILADREEFFRRLPHLDYCYLPTTDYSGCCCPACQPWARTYLRLVEATAALARKYHPECRIILSTQQLPPDQQEMIVDSLQSHPAWVDYLQVWGSGGFGDTHQASPAAIRRRVPQGYPLLVYPEITMTGGWGAFGAHVMVDRFDYNLGQGGFARLAPYVAGSFPYSEGLHDDLIKVIWCQKEWTHTRPPREVLDEYCRWYFGEAAAPLIAQAILLMADNWSHHGEASQAARVVRLLGQAKARVPDWASNGWRIRLLRLRALMDSYQADRDLLALGGAPARAALRRCVDQRSTAAARRNLAAARDLLDAPPGPDSRQTETEALRRLLEADGFRQPAPPGFFAPQASERQRFVRAQIDYASRDPQLERLRQAAFCALDGWIEAEDFLPLSLAEETPTASGWKWGSNIGGYTGRGHLVSQARASGLLTRTVRVPVAGEYLLWVRDQNHQGGHRGTDGSLRMRVNGQPTPAFGRDPEHVETWTWTLLGHFRLGPGAAELAFEDGGDGHSVTDCVLLSADRDYRPEGIVSGEPAA